MKRIVYSPKVYAYVQTSDHHVIEDGEYKEGALVNISDYIVSGSVTRRINQPSSAELVIRNPDRMWTQPSGPTFYPMDKITIFMQRLPGHAVQTFTGYLDKTPYYQMYPGTCTLSATCTLKRLLYNYFDPGLPFMINFMREYGWIVDVTTGQIMSTPAGSTSSASTSANTSTNASTGNDDTTGNQAQRTYAATTMPTDKKILVIGDSIGVKIQTALYNRLAAKGWKVTPESTSVGSEPLNNWGVDQIQSIASRGRLPNTILIALGTNDLGSSAAAFGAGVQKVLNHSQGAEVYWVNIGVHSAYHMGRSKAEAAANRLNTVLSQKSAANSKLHIIDYHSLVANGSIKLTEDGIHPYSNSEIGKRVTQIITSLETGGGSSAAAPSVSSQELATQDIAAYEATMNRDNSVATLLYAVLNHIGHWHDSEIYIEKLPKTLLKSLSTIYKELITENALLRDQVEAFLTSIVGPGEQGGGSPTTGDLSTGNASGEAEIVPILIKAAERFNVPPVFVINTVINEGSGFNTSTLESGGPGRAQGDVGLFQQQTAAEPYSSTAMHMVGYGRDLHPPKPWTHEQSTDAGLSSNLFCAAASLYFKAHPGMSRANWGQAAKDIQVSDGYPNWGSTMATAESLYNQYKDSATTQLTGDTSNLGSVPAAGNSGSGGGGWEYYGSVPRTLNAPMRSFLDRMGTFVDKPIEVTTTTNHDYLTADGNVSDHNNGGAADLGSVANNFKIGDATGGGLDIAIAAHRACGESYETARKNAMKPNYTRWPSPEGGVQILWMVPGHDNHVHIGLGSGGKPANGTSDAGTADGSTTAADSSGDSSGGTGGAGRAAAVAAVFDLPGVTNQEESLLLPPDRSLMNDQPLMPFVEQLADGSLRNFQSMPNGNFHAFFPDYFGSFGKQPYWAISDLEVLEGKIELTDKNIATHVFVVGDTLNVSPATDFVSALGTAGVVNIMNAGRADFINKPKDKIVHTTDTYVDKGDPLAKKKKVVDTNTDELPTFLGDLETSLAFLRRYGARPHREDIPMLRSHPFELFVAFQTFMLMWSRQFLTSFTFTFMPEIYPGGLVAFPKHGLQCYVEEVTHTFDYTGGFTTKANLTAAAALNNTDNPYATGLVKAGAFKPKEEKKTTHKPGKPSSTRTVTNEDPVATESRADSVSHSATSISSHGVHFIRGFEGFVGHPYQDSVGVWTIGYGHTNGVHSGTNNISREEGTRLLSSDLNNAEDTVKSLHLNLTQYQFDALVSFVFNTGSDSVSSNTHIGKALRKHDWTSAANHMLEWDKDGNGNPIPGLTRRRKAERAMFLGV